MAGVIKGERGEKPTANPVAKPAAKQPVQAPASPGAIKTANEPRPNVIQPRVIPPRVTGPPVPALQQHGYHGSISDFNDRVQAVHDSYQKSYGVPPSPQLTLDLAKSPVDSKDFQAMFKVPLTQFGARTRGTLVAQGVHTQADTMPPFSAKELADGIKKAAVAGNYHDYIDQHADLIHQFSYQNKADAATLAGAIFRSRRLDAERRVQQQVADGDITPFEAKQQLQAAGFLPGGVSVMDPHGPFGLAAKAIGQVTESLVHSPAGLYELGQAIGLDTRDIIVHPEQHHFRHTAPIGKAMGKSIAQDVQHPSQNPGYLFLDILGFVSPIAGAGARGAEAGRLLRAGEGAGAASKALVTKAPLKRVELRHGSLTEEMPLSQNPLVAAAQKFIVGRRQAASDRRLAGDAPAGIRSILLPRVANDLLDEHLSFETKLGREADARKRVDHIVNTTLSRELDHVAGRSVTQARIHAAVPSKIRGGLTRGEQKAIQVLSWDDPNPLQAERDFHHRMIDMGIGDPKAHKIQLADLKLAEKALKNPSVRFRKALALTHQVVDEMETMKIRDLGLVVETAEGRVAKAGQVLRGEEPVGVSPSERVLPVRYDDISRYASSDIPLDEQSRLMPKGDYLYHSTDTEAFPDIVKQGLRPGKDRPGEVTGVYFGQDWADINSLRPGRKRSGDVLLRVHRKNVNTEVTDSYEKDSGFEEHVSRNPVAPASLEYLGSDGRWHPLSQHGKGRSSGDSFYLPTQPRGKVKRPPSDSAGFYSPKAGPFGIPPGRDMPELTHEFTGKALQAGDYRIDATSLATEAYGRTVRAATVRAEHARLWDAASAKPYGAHSIPIRDVNAIPDKLRTVVARLDEGDFGPKDAEVLPADMRELIEELYPDKRKLTADEIEHVRWIDARLLGQGNVVPHVPGSPAKISQAVQGPLRVGVLYLRPAYILNKLGNHAMGLLDEDWMWPANYAKALSMDERYGPEATRTIHELVGAGKSRSYVAAPSGRFSQGLAEFWNKVADRGERAAAFISYMERKGYKTHAQVNDLLFNPEKRADLTEISRRANKSLVEFDNLLPIEKNYLRHFIFVYPWVSRSVVWSLRTIMEHPTKVAILSKLGEEDAQSDPIFKNAPAWFKRTGYIPVGWNSDGTPRIVNPTSVNSFSTLGDFLSLAKAVTTGDKYGSAEDFLGPAPKFLAHAVSGRDEFGNQYPGSQWWDAAKEALGQLPQVSAYKKAGDAKQAKGGLPNVADRRSLETSLNKNLHATVLSPGWLNGYGSLIAGGLSPRDVNTDALTARYWADQSPEKRHARELDLLNRALDIQGGVLKESVPASVRAAVKTQAEIDFQYKNFLKQNGRTPTDKERAIFTIDYLSKKGLLPNAAKWKAKLGPLADTADINRLKNTLLDKYANGKALRLWDTDIRTVASFNPEVFNQKAAELYKQGLSPQKRFNVGQEKLYDYGRKYVAFTREVRKMQDAGATPDELRAFQDAHDVSVDGLPSFVRIAWSNQTPEEQAQATTSAAARSWRDNTAFEKALLGRPSDAKVTAGWSKLREIVETQRAQLKREGRSFPSGYERTLAKYVEKYYDAPGLVKDYDFAQQPLVSRLKFLSPVQKSPNKDQWGQLLSLAGTYAKWLEAKNADGSRVYSALQVRQSWEDYVASPPFQSWMKQNPAFHAEISNYGKSFLSSLVG